VPQLMQKVEPGALVVPHFGQTTINLDLAPGQATVRS